MKLSVKYCFLIVISLFNIARCEPFIRCVDITTHTRQVQDGVIYKEYGTPKDLLDILKNHDINWIRLRVFHTPTGQTYGVEDLDYVTTLAAQIKNAGLKFLLDLHYSDTWADPGHQNIPVAWTGMDHTELVTAVHDYTRDVVVHLRTNGAMPDMVQIGNEIICGMLWPDGNVCSGGSWSNLAELINAGIAGVTEGAGAETMPRIMIHIDRGGDWAATQNFFDHIIAQGVLFDVIGQSFYPEWHGTLDDLNDNLQNMANTYDQPIFIVEAGDYYTGRTGKTPESQKTFLEQVIARVKKTPNGKGLGVCYWEPAWVWSSGVGYRALFERTDQTWKNFNMLPAMEAFDIDLDSMTACNEVWQEGFGLAGDVNRDCYVNFDDLAMFFYYWLFDDCSSDPDCQNSDLPPTDGNINLSDFALISIDWNRCNHPANPNCQKNWLD